MPSLGNARREAGDLLDEARWLLKKHGKLVVEEKRKLVKQAQSDLEGLRKGKDAQAIADLTGKLDKLLQDPGEDQDIAVLGDFNVAPADIDVWDPSALAGMTHVSDPEREAVARLVDAGLPDQTRDGLSFGVRRASG